MAKQEASGTQSTPDVSKDTSRLSHPTTPSPRGSIEMEPGAASTVLLAPGGRKGGKRGSTSSSTGGGDAEMSLLSPSTGISSRKRGSTDTDASYTSTSTTPRLSVQTDSTMLSGTPRSSFQITDSPQLSSKAGVVITSSRASTRRSSTHSAAAAFAAATAGASNPREIQQPRGYNRLHSAGKICKFLK